MTKLVFGGHVVTAAGLVPFLASPSLTRVTYFMTLHCRSVGPDVIPGILASPSAPVLEEVGLQQNGLGAAAGRHFRELFRLPRLRRLDLEMNQVGDEGAERAAAVEVETDLRINLGWNHIADRGAAALSRGPLLRPPGVRVSLAGNQLSDEMKARLKDAFGDRVSV
jgi:hypothetical protein